MDNSDTISRLCKLLNLSDATIASEVRTASDAELLVDFLVVVCLVSPTSLRIIANLSLIGTPYGNPRQLE